MKNNMLFCKKAGTEQHHKLEPDNATKGVIVAVCLTIAFAGVLLAWYACFLRSLEDNLNEELALLRT